MPILKDKVKWKIIVDKVSAIYIFLRSKNWI